MKKTIICIIGMMMSLWLLPNNVFALDNKQYQERADAVFRPLDNMITGFFDEHTGIYNEYKSGSPTELTNHTVIQMITTGVKEQNFNIFKTGEFGSVPIEEYRGAFTSGTLNKEKRDRIIDEAGNLSSKPFANDPQLHVVEFLNDPWDTERNGKLDISEIKALRCDGFVEYCYRAAGENIGGMDIYYNPEQYNETKIIRILIPLPGGGFTYIDVEVTKYSPKHQRESMVASSARNPTKVTELESTTHAEKQWSNENDIKFAWKDASDDASGVKGYFVNFMNVTPTHYDPFIDYDIEQFEMTDVNDGKKNHNFVIRSIDGAGNWGQDDWEACTAWIGPFWIDTLPPFTVTNLQPVSPALEEWCNDGKISLFWTKAEDDTEYVVDTGDEVSGVDGYSVMWSNKTTDMPDEVKDINAVASETSTSYTSATLPDGKNHYFHIRSVDKAENWDDAAVSIGPFWVDATEPLITVTVLDEDEDCIPGGEPWVIGRLFRVDIVDPIVNNARSCLDYFTLNGKEYTSCRGFGNYNQTIYVETPAHLKVEAYDLAGNRGYVDRVNPDPYFIQAPRWENIHDLDIPFEDYAISPTTSTGVKDDVLIEYTLEKPAHIFVKIYNESGNLIKVIKDTDETVGTHSFTWNGTNASSQVVPNGKYYYVVEEMDYLSDALVFETHGLIIVDNTLPIVTIESSSMDTPKWGYLTLQTNITEPNLDDINIFYKLSSGGTYNNTTPRKRILLNGKWNIELDTTDWADGLYDIKVEALDLAGNAASQVTQINIQRGTTSTVRVYDIKTGTSYQTSPYRAYLKYFLSKQANLKIEIYTEGMSFVKQIANETQTFGKHTVYWDGTNSSGAQVAGGKYKYKITASADPTLSIIGDITLKKVRVYISCPWQDSLVRAYVPVEGYATGTEFQSYKLEYGEGKDPTIWTIIVAQSTTQVTGGLLGNWDTGYEFESYCSPVPYPYELLRGEYTLRLSVTDTHNNTYEDKVTVIVGRVISNELGGEGISPDDKVHLIVEPLTLHGSFEVVSIMPVELAELAPTDKTIIGDVYELQPPMLGFSEPATLTMAYTTDDLGAHNEAKLGIYIWDILKKRWKYLETTKDLTNNILTTQIREIPRYHAYIAILADETVPQAPRIFEPVSPIYRQSAHIFGMTEPQNTAEIFNNSTSKGTFKADYDYGYFSTYLKDLSLGNNVLTAKSTDPANNISPLSSSRTIVVELHEPSSVSSIGLKTADFITNYTESSVKVGDTLYIELQGLDSSASIVDVVRVKLTTSISNPTGIVASLTETGPNAGIYRGIAYVGIRSDEINRTIGAINNETLTIAALQDPGVNITINVESTELIDAPSVYSTTHPSVCQNTFEDNLGEWANRSGADGATVLRDNTTSKIGVYSAKITNEHDGGDFSCYALTSSYYAEEYPVLSFDYKITPDVKTNFKVKVNGVFKNIIFTDDLETDGSAITTIGSIDNVIKDGQWHHADISLYKLLKADEPQVTSFLVDEIIMGDWDLDYWYTTVPGNSNALGATYWIDNFIITNYITDNDTVDISFEPNQSYAVGYSYILDELPDTTPDKVSEGVDTDIQYASLSDGSWYLHVSSCDEAGNWSLPNHYILAKDTTSPELISISPTSGETSGNANIEIQITDDVSGVDTDTISLEVEGMSYGLTNQGLTYDETTNTITFAPYNVTPTPIVFTNGQVINVRLAQAKDKAGNAITPYTWSYTYSVANDITPPNPPTILYPETSDIGLSSVTFSWIATDTSGIAGYSYILDGTADTIPDDTLEGVLTEKKYSNLPEGTYYFHIKAKDNAGNWSETTHFTLNIAHRSLLVDDFNDGSDPNELGGASGVFDSGGDNRCRKGYVTGVILGSSGYSIMLNYYTVGTNSYSGYWMSLNHASLIGYKSLSFWVKGGQNGEKFRVGLKDSLNHESKVNIDLYLKGGTSTSWQQVVIPLVMFKDVTGWADMDNFSITFENAIDPSGDIYIEDIEFISENGKIVVDNFDDGHDPNAFGAGYYVVTNGATMTMAYMPGIGIDGTYCYRVTYNGVTADKYCKLVMFFGADINISDTDTLSFYIKGAVGGERPNIHLYDGHDVYLHIENYKTVTTSWQRVDIPLIDFSSQGLNLTRVRELGFAFEWETMSGTIYLDNVEFVSYALSIKPSLNDTPAVTKTSPVTLSGRKSAGTSIWVNGLEIVPLNYSETWSASFPLQQGTNNLAVLAKDGNGNESEAIYRIIYLDTQSPISVINADKLYSKTSPVNLDGSASFDNYGIASYSWNFEDGTPLGSGAIVNHTYANSGTYNVTLTVTDIAGNSPATTAKEITVINSVVKKVGGTNPDFSSIQESLDNSLSGNTIYVRPGTYEEAMVVLENKDGLVLLGDGAIIEGNLAFLDSDIEMDGFTIKYGEGTPVEFANSHYADLKIIADAGITAVDSELIIKNCIITPNLDIFTDSYGKGIQIWNMYQGVDKTPTIENNLILNADTGVSLFSQAFGGRILGEIKNNTFVANDTGILLRMHKENPIIKDNIITDAVDGVHITYEDSTLLNDRILNIMGNDFFNNTHNIWCDAIQEECTPVTGNLYEDPDLDADYIPRNPACDDKGYSLP